MKIIDLYKNDRRILELKEHIEKNIASAPKIELKKISGSFRSVISASLLQNLFSSPHLDNIFLFILPNKEDAAYFHNDLEQLFGADFKGSISYFPSSYKNSAQIELGDVDNANVLYRTEVLNKIAEARADSSQKLLIVSYPEALVEKVVCSRSLVSNTIQLKKGEEMSIDSLIDFLESYGFEYTDFVASPGEYAVRGGILDVFSFADELPFRIEFSGDEIESIRSFEVGNQLSVEKKEHVSILPNISTRIEHKELVDFFSNIPEKALVFVQNLRDILSNEDFSSLNAVEKYAAIEFGAHSAFKECSFSLDFSSTPQILFNKNFSLMAQHFMDSADQGFKNFILSNNPKQFARLERVFFELSPKENPIRFIPIEISLNEGFIDLENKWGFFTDHQIFERYNRYKVQKRRDDRNVLSLKELYQLKPGDYICHVDHGVGKFAGLEKIKVNGKEQEAICLVYKDGDRLRISIHSLHKISRYSGKDAEVPKMNRLGSNAWAQTKAKAKQKVKDIARELIKLYAQRKASKGFAFSADSYLQNELESSFFYEDTPDQSKVTADVKQDMEAWMPMDRLVCGDVGFGKTEIAIRAAFKAVCDKKQVAVLVPTTILAYQHYKTFSDRLSSWACSIDYINRFRSTKEKKEILQRLKEGKIDILIGTHRLLSKDVVFNDLGLLVIDEEQKFGVAMKEKLKQFKVNVDTLTLTATPIPRTLQFSLMGARDLSIMQTPPPNRYPIYTEIHTFDQEYIRDIIMQELSRGGQVFFVNDRIENILEIASLLQRLLPDAQIAVAHGQTDGDKLEEILLAFMEGAYDILVSTKIVENGLDIPNANTIIVNEAHRYGLSELHQLRGRVGRSNKKAYCYLLSPPQHLLTNEAKKRLSAIEEFSDVGGGFQIAMRDLDIRGAGNILGGEQSGFIEEMGFDMYQKILDDAIRELKTEEFESLGIEKSKEDEFANIDCSVETDLEILFPDSYISNTTERLALYKELDAIEDEEKLQKYRLNLEDRFGPLPRQAEDLIKTVTLRKKAESLGFSRLLLKNSKMKVYFAAKDESEYYRSESFGKILNYLQDNASRCSLKDDKASLSLEISNVESIDEARALCEAFSA